MVGVEGCRICGDPVSSHLEPDLRSYSVLSIEGRNNILFRIFADAGISPPTENATKWGNSLHWLERSIEEARAYQRRLDQEYLEKEVVLRVRDIHCRFPLRDSGMEKIRREGW
jgi:hypothetical protein